MALGYIPIQRHQTIGPFRPVAGNGDLYVIAFSQWSQQPDSEQPDPSQPSFIAAYRSANEGIDWEQVGDEIEVVSPTPPAGEFGPTSDPRNIGVSKDPSTNRIWVCYWATGSPSQLKVRYFSMETDTWSEESSGAFSLTESSPSDAERFYTGNVCVACSTNGDVYVACRPGRFEGLGAQNDPQVWWRKLSGGFADPSAGTWGAKTEMSGEGDTPAKVYGALSLIPFPISGEVWLVSMFAGYDDGMGSQTQPFLICMAVDDGTGSASGTYYPGPSFVAPYSINAYPTAFNSGPSAGVCVSGGVAYRNVGGIERFVVPYRPTTMDGDGVLSFIDNGIYMMEFDVGDGWTFGEMVTEQEYPCEFYVVEDGGDTVYLYYQKVDDSSNVLCRKSYGGNPVTVGDEEIMFAAPRFEPPDPEAQLWGWIMVFGAQTGSHVVQIGQNYLTPPASQFGPFFTIPAPEIGNLESKQYKIPIRVGTIYDCCLDKFADRIRRSGIEYKHPCEMEWVQGQGQGFGQSNGYQFPKLGIEFWKRGSIPTPEDTDGDVVVMEFDVPTGYDGLIYGLVCSYTGTGFEDGAGDLEWRLKIGPVYARNYGNVIYRLGTPEQPLQLSDHIKVRSGQTIQWIVRTVGGSIVPDTTRVNCAVQGWFYPITNRR